MKPVISNTGIVYQDMNRMLCRDLTDVGAELGCVQHITDDRVNLVCFMPFCFGKSLPKPNTSYPSAHSFWLTAQPMPEEAPVTMAAFVFVFLFIHSIEKSSPCQFFCDLCSQKLSISSIIGAG